LVLQQQLRPPHFDHGEIARIFSLSSLLKKVSSEIDLFNKAGFFQTPLYINGDGFRNALEI